MVFYHIYVASYILVTLDIILFSFVLWKQLMKAPSVDNVSGLFLILQTAAYIYHRSVFHSRPEVCLPLASDTGPFHFTLDIVTSLPQGTILSIDYDALLLTTVLVEGLSYFCVLFCLLATRKS